MNHMPETPVAARDELIAELERQTELQDKIIREQRTLIQMQEQQLSEFQKLLKQILNA